MAIVGRVPAYQNRLQGLEGAQRREFLAARPQIAAQQAAAAPGGMAARIQDRTAYLQAHPQLMAKRAAAGGKIAQAAMTSSTPPTQLPPQQQQQAVGAAMDQMGNAMQQSNLGYSNAAWGGRQLTPEQIARMQQMYGIATQGNALVNGFPNAR